MNQLKKTLILVFDVIAQPPKPPKHTFEIALFFLILEHFEWIERQFSKLIFPFPLQFSAIFDDFSNFSVKFLYN